jgi:hypothetical protein
LDKLAEIQQKVTRSADDPRALEELIDTTPSGMIDLFSRIVGANLGGMSGLGRAAGSPLVLSQHGSRIVRNITHKLPLGKVRKILNQAVTDPELMRTLLLRVDIPKNAEKVARRLNAWMLAEAATGLQENADDETQ